MPDPDQTDPAAPAHDDAALKAAFRRLAAPLARLMMDAGITFPVMAEMLRETVVAEARAQLAAESVNQSRLAVVTGVHRKELRRLLEAPSEPAPRRLTLAARVVSAWLAEPELVDPASGQPKPLPRQAPAESWSFDRLVSSITTDVRPKVVLDELLRLGVSRLVDDRVELTASGVGPDGAYADKAYYFGRNLADHIATGAHNLAGHEPRFLDRAVFYDGLDAAALAELRAFCEAEGTRLLLEINRRAAALAGPAGTAGRMTFGTFYFEAPADGAGDGSEQGDD